MVKPAIRMQAIKIIGWACVGLLIGSVLTLAGGLTWWNRHDEVGALAISVLGMVIVLSAVCWVLVGAFQAVTGRRTRFVRETLRVPAESATSMAGAEHGSRPAASVEEVGLSKGPTKSKRVAYLLWLLFGWAGVHRFYCRKWFTGSVWLLTLGLFGLGWGADAVLTFFLVDQANGIPPQEDASKSWNELRIFGAYFAGPLIGLCVVGEALSWISAKFDKRPPAQEQRDAQRNWSRIQPPPERELAQQSRGTPATGKVTTHNDAVHGYTLSYPASWRAPREEWLRLLREKATDRKLMFVAVSPDDKLWLQVAVFNDPPREGESLKHLLEGMLKNGSIPSENARTTDIEIDGQKAIRYLADATTPVGQPARYVFVLLIRNGRVWIFGIGGNRSRFQDDQKGIDGIVQSIRFCPQE